MIMHAHTNEDLSARLIARYPHLNLGALGLGASTNKPRTKKKVIFAEQKREHRYDPYNGYGPPPDAKLDEDGGVKKSSTQLTEELTLLSTLHARARRQLRDISKHDTKTVVKYGTKTPAAVVKGEQRWKFEYDNTVVITDQLCSKEITSYKKAIQIEQATITQSMLDHHAEALRVLKEDPHMCTSHTIIIIDQSASMKIGDVECFRSRSEASYGTLALDYIAEQLYPMGDDFVGDAVSIIEMNDKGSLFADKEPMDWILFNSMLYRLKSSRPRSHGNYVKSLEFAERIITRELTLYADLDEEDLPRFMLIFISDGRPSDCRPEDEASRESIIARIAYRLKSKLTVQGMGLGVASDFEQLKLLVNTAKLYGAQGQFNHAGLNPAALSSTLSSIATSMTTTRNELCSVTGMKVNKTEKNFVMKQKDDKNCPYRIESKSIARYRYNSEDAISSRDGLEHWKKITFFNKACAGFFIEKDPFGKGAERLAFMFQELVITTTAEGKQQWSKVGRPMVAKESRYIERESKGTFHLNFCRIQHKAFTLAKLFNDAVRRAPLLRPAKDEVSLPPPIFFLRCSIYQYLNDKDEKRALLVEDFLMGKFTKFNSNNGYVREDDPNGASIELVIGTALLTDFVQALSHWVYVHSKHQMIVCDLQGILDMEGRRPVFRLTDPAICSKPKKDRHGNKISYGKTDQGMTGIRNFCCNHVCNTVCAGLNLTPTGARVTKTKA